MFTSAFSRQFSVQYEAAFDVPMQFLNNSPSLFFAFEVLYLNHFISSISFERSNRFCVLEYDVGTTKSEFFFQHSWEIRC